jgi:hypothetical protein
MVSGTDPAQTSPPSTDREGICRFTEDGDYRRRVPLSHQSLKKNPRARGWLTSASLIMALLAVVMIFVLPATARTGSIQAIDNADMIFVYEENLDI